MTTYKTGKPQKQEKETAIAPKGKLKKIIMHIPESKIPGPVRLTNRLRSYLRFLSVSKVCFLYFFFSLFARLHLDQSALWLIRRTLRSSVCIAWSSRAFKSLPGARNLLLVQAKVLLSRDHTNGVGVALSAAPALDTDDVVALVDDAELESVVDTPLEAAVHILLPDLNVEVGLGLGECEGPDATVQVRVLSCLSATVPPAHRRSMLTYPRGHGVAGDHEDGANGTVLGKETSGFSTGQSVNRAVLHCHFHKRGTLTWWSRREWHRRSVRDWR